MTAKFKFHTQYNQFYIQDKNSIGDTDAAVDFWTEEAYEKRLAISNNLLGVGTQSYGIIKGEIELLTQQISMIDFDLYDHIVEAGLEINNNELQITDCPTNAIEARLKLENGKYRVRIYSLNLGSVLETDLANDTDDDYYRIEVWPDENMELRVLKKYKL